MRRTESLQSKSKLLDSSRISRDRQERVLVVADSCFEMFSIRELSQPNTIYDEVASYFYDVSEIEILEALKLALSWRRLLKGSLGIVH